MLFVCVWLILDICKAHIVRSRITWERGMVITNCYWGIPPPILIEEALESHFDPASDNDCLIFGKRLGTIMGGTFLNTIGVFWLYIMYARL